MAKKEKKIFVLDTSVIIYDHEALTNFGEHDVAIPITVLEELDNFKKGNDTKNFQARAFIRQLDQLSQDNSLQDWIPINGPSKGKFKVLMNLNAQVNAERIFNDHKNDHRILDAALVLHEDPKVKANVILVTKDINLRVKAKSLNLQAEDYETGKIKDISDLWTGQLTVDKIDADTIDKLYANREIEWQKVTKEKPIANCFYILKSAKSSVLSYYNSTTDMIERVEKMNAKNITPKNAEQAFALHAITDPSISLVTISGVAGSGKTLLALAGALEKKRHYKQIYLARPIVPLSNKDIGFLPGDIKSKLNPYMEPLWDNLKFIKNQFADNSAEQDNIDNMVNNEKLVIQPLAYIRGRSLLNVFFIVDEAQNLTPHEIKTIITRAGDGTKIVFTGDINQIDTPYLDTQSNGLSYLIDKIRDHPLYAHVSLERGERSDLANLANDLL